MKILYTKHVVITFKLAVLTFNFNKLSHKLINFNCFINSVLIDITLTI